MGYRQKVHHTLNIAQHLLFNEVVFNVSIENARCGRIALMQSGQILQVDSPEGIRASYPYTLWAVHSERMIPLLTDLRQSPEVETAYSFGESYHVTLRAGSRGVEALRTSLLQAGHTSVSIVEISPSVEDCFMALLPGVS